MPGQSTYDVAIIGGGASGLAAAVSAARAGQRVAIVERDVEMGLPILATGNGRCNLSNIDLDPVRYRHPDIARTVMGEQPEAELAAFFDSLGLMTCEVDGRLYPYSKRADSVREALLMAALRPGTKALTCTEVERAAYDESKGIWNLEVSRPAKPLPLPKKPLEFKALIRAQRKELRRAERARETLFARRVIIACGGSSEHLAELFGLPHIPEEPVLCPVACLPAQDSCPEGLRDSVLRWLDGLRVDCRLSLVRNGASIWTEDGEVLFRAYGLSGIVAFDLSRRCIPGDTVEIDLFPNYSEHELVALFARRAESFGDPENMAATWFTGLLDGDLSSHVANIAERTGGHTCASYACTCKHLPFEVLGTTEHASAQVRRGGIPFDAIDIPSMSVEPDIAPALSACGEALDMDADCGGYNLAWAWISGIRAASASPAR